MLIVGFFKLYLACIMYFDLQLLMCCILFALILSLAALMTL